MVNLDLIGLAKWADIFVEMIIGCMQLSYKHRTDVISIIHIVKKCCCCQTSYLFILLSVNCICSLGVWCGAFHSSLFSIFSVWLSMWCDIVVLLYVGIPYPEKEEVRTLLRQVSNLLFRTTKLLILCLLSMILPCHLMFYYFNNVSPRKPDK